MTGSVLGAVTAYRQIGYLGPGVAIWSGVEETGRTGLSDIEVRVGPGVDLLAAPCWDSLVGTSGTIFQDSRFLLTWWRDTAARHPESQFLAVTFVDGWQTVGVCAFELRDGCLSFAGGRDVVDYMGPVAGSGHEKDVAEALTAVVFDDLAGPDIRLRGLVAEDPLAQALMEAVRRRAPHATISAYDQAPRILAAPKGYLSLLTSKRRGEVLRKRRRLVEEMGEVRLVTSTPATWEGALQRLLTWKAGAGPAMRDFVVRYGDFMRRLIGELATTDSANVVELWAESRPLASAIVLSHRRTRYLYNMAYDVGLTADARTGLAPGVVLVSHLVETALDEGLVFDFLKGAQDYKVRLGGIPEQIMEITARS